MLRLSLCMILLTLMFSLPALATEEAQDVAAPESEPLNIRELTGLLGQPLPERFSTYVDVNPDDKYAGGIDVLSGQEKLWVGPEAIDVTMLLFVRDGVVGAIKVDQSYTSFIAAKNPQMQYDLIRAGLLATDALRPYGEPALSDNNSTWAFGEDGKGVALVAKGYDTQGLAWYAYGAEMDASYHEYWTNWNSDLSGLGLAFGLM